jgi:hypothetical protein
MAKERKVRVIVTPSPLAEVKGYITVSIHEQLGEDTHGVQVSVVQSLTKEIFYGESRRQSVETEARLQQVRGQGIGGLRGTAHLDDGVCIESGTKKEGSTHFTYLDDRCCLRLTVNCSLQD